ncbi:MAG TPA: sigma-70 family RNA polymerase sigma factor [Acidimicrobiales bacterium]|jgi:RNA polymerase sigma factor (sigma-70 family)
MLVENQAPGTEFEQVYTSELQAITRLAYLLVRVPAVAEELAQDAFLRLYERFAEVDSPAAWLRTAVVRLAIGWQRRQQTERRKIPVWVGRPALGAPELDEVWVALGRLSRERQTVLVLRFYEDMSYRDIAALLGWSPATVRSRARRGLNDLRREVTR